MKTASAWRAANSLPSSDDPAWTSSGCPWGDREALSASASPAEVTMFQPARPPLMWSREANLRATWKGSLYVVETVAMSPTWSAILASSW